VELIEAGEAAIKAEAAIEAEAAIKAARRNAPAGKAAIEAAKATKVTAAKTAKMAAAKRTAMESTAAKPTAVESTASTATVAAAECQGRAARGQRRAKRDRGQQYTEAFHIHSPPEGHCRRRRNERSRVSAVYSSKDNHG
jgi:hypothetical protein